MDAKLQLPIFAIDEQLAMSFGNELNKNMRDELAWLSKYLTM